MTETSADRPALRRPALGGLGAVVSLGVVALALIVVSLSPSPVSKWAWGGAGAGVFLGAIGVMLAAGVRRLFRRGWLRMVRRIVLSDPWPSVLTDSEGRIQLYNSAAGVTFSMVAGGDLAEALGRELVAPEALVKRLLEGTSDADHAALETLQVDHSDLSISTQRLAGDVILWRFKFIRNDAEDRLKQVALPVVSGSPGHGWEPQNAAAHSRVGRSEALSSTGPPAIAGHVAHVIADIGDRQSVLYVPEAVDDADASGVEETTTLDMLIQGLPVPILRISTSGEIRTANGPARRLLCLDGDPEPSPALYEIVEGMGRSVSDWLADAVACRGLVKPEFVRASLPDKDVYLQIVLGRIEQQGGTELIGILNDATELKTLEANFVQSQKMQAIGQLAGGVAHDFNNLLTAISGHCDLLLLRHDQSDPDYSDLKQIAHNTNRASSLVGQLLAFSRKQALKAQPLDLHETMSDLTHLLNRLVGEKVTLTLNIAPLDKVIRADRRGFEQVIMNLVVNARDAMPYGVPFEISVEELQLDAPLERDRAVVEVGDYIVVKVRDRGHGIEPERLGKIFEPFYTTKKTGEGTGLGLSTAYGIVKQSGGFIFAESEIGQGTCFTLMFAAHLRELVIDAPVPPPKRAPSAVRQHGVVLLVEDEAPVRAFASRALRLRGYTVLEAEDAESALALLSDKAIHIDVFVTDVIMPGLDGPTWVRHALEDRPDTRVVFVSGYSQERLSESQARVPNSVFLAKPFSLTELTDTVQEQLDKTQ